MGVVMLLEVRTTTGKNLFVNVNEIQALVGEGNQEYIILANKEYILIQQDFDRLKKYLEEQNLLNKRPMFG
jgi:hypothetical protein